MRHFVRTPEKPTKLSDANGATIRGIHLMRGAGGHGRKIKGGTKENAMPKQGTWLRTAAVAIASVSLSLSVLSAAQANQRADATMYPKKHYLRPSKFPPRFMGPPRAYRGAGGHIGTCSHHACPHGPRETRIITEAMAASLFRDHTDEVIPVSRRRYSKARCPRLHRDVLAIAPANKLARIAWSVLARGQSFEIRPAMASAA
jgi:hypothetical protein